jgi:hypothetical protein
MYTTHVRVYSLCILRKYYKYTCVAVHAFSQIYFIIIKLSLNKMQKGCPKFLTLNSYYRKYHQLTRRNFKVEANLGTLL